MRNLDRLAHRVARCVDLVLGEAIVNGRSIEALRCTADEDERINALADELHEIREVRHLVIAAREQDDVPVERLERLDSRVRVRRLRVVVVRHAVDRRHVLDAVLDAAERLEHGDHQRGLAASEEGLCDGREGILDVVRPLDAELIRMAELVFLPLPADDDEAVLHITAHEDALFEFLAAAEVADLRHRARLHAARLLVVVVEDEIVVRRLLAEEALLHGLVDLHRAMAHDVVRRHVEHGRDMRVEVLRRLHLVARDLRRDAAALADAHGLLRQRHADVAADADLVVMRLEQQAEERRRRRLAIRARHRTDRRLRDVIGELHLAHDADALFISGLDQRDAHRHGRRDDDRIHALEQALLLWAEGKRNAERA